MVPKIDSREELELEERTVRRCSKRDKGGRDEGPEVDNPRKPQGCLEKKQCEEKYKYEHHKNNDKSTQRLQHEE